LPIITNKYKVSEASGFASVLFEQHVSEVSGVASVLSRLSIDLACGLSVTR
jgi:hypothetical protein